MAKLGNGMAGQGRHKGINNTFLKGPVLQRAEKKHKRYLLVVGAEKGYQEYRRCRSPRCGSPRYRSPRAELQDAWPLDALPKQLSKMPRMGPCDV